MKKTETKSTVLLHHHLKALRLPTVAAECEATATHDGLRPGDVLVGGRAFGTFAHLAVLIARGLHGMYRDHQNRIVDFRPGRPHAVPGSHLGHSGRPRSRWVRALGPSDQLLDWYRPQTRPHWLTVEEYAALPRQPRIREWEYQVSRPGFRVRSVTLVTTPSTRPCTRRTRWPTCTARGGGWRPTWPT